MKRILLAITLVVVAACSAQKPLTPAQLAAAQTRVEALRQRWAPRASTIPIRGRFHDPSGRDIEGRGALALEPSLQALRMMLVSPAGVTAFDLWIRGTNYRLSMPLHGKTTRGDRPQPNLPVEFLSWWLLRPFEGVIEEASSEGFTLKDRDAVYRVEEHKDGSIEVERRSKGAVERIHAQRPGCAGAKYRNESFKLEVTIECDETGSSTGSANPKAFEDPELSKP